jgi:hypothetical protein
MVQPSQIADGLVTLLRLIPSLVQLTGSDAGNIFPYHDQFPKRSSLARALHEMPNGSLMVAWAGSGPVGVGGMEQWQHMFSIYCRAQEEDLDTPNSYYAIFRLVVDGVPVSDVLNPSSQPMFNLEVVPECNPMNPPSIAREADANALDYFHISITFVEK